MIVLSSPFFVALPRFRRRVDQDRFFSLEHAKTTASHKLDDNYHNRSIASGYLAHNVANACYHGINDHEAGITLHA